MAAAMGVRHVTTDRVKAGLAAAVMALTLAATVALMHWASPDSAAAHRGAGAPLPVAARPAPAIVAPDVSRAAPVPVPMATRPTVIAGGRAVAATRAARADEAEVCGLGAVPLSDDDPSGASKIPPAIRTAALDRLDATLSAHPDDRVRAAALLLRSRRGHDPGVLAGVVADDAACRLAQAHGAEQTAAFCAAELGHTEQELLRASAPAIDELARLAAGTRDPVVYALAIEGCRGTGLSFARAEGYCELITAEQWARIDPGNAVPWLHAAADARARGDEPAAAQALYRASAARTSDAYAGAMAALVLQSLPADLPLLQRTAVTLELQQVAAPRPPRHHAVIVEACNPSPGLDPDQARVCDALASTLAAHGRSTAEVTAGVQLGERLGWPAERSNRRLLAQSDALAAARQFTASPQPLGCAAIGRQHAWAAMVWVHGEEGAARELMRHPEPPAHATARALSATRPVAPRP